MARAIQRMFDSTDTPVVTAASLTRRATRTLTEQLADRFAARIHDRLLAPGARLPSVRQCAAQHGLNPARPPFWGGYRIRPLEIEFWADGAFRLHDRFRWTRRDASDGWVVARLNP